jgi:hypothetical protein
MSFRNQRIINRNPTSSVGALDAKYLRNEEKETNNGKHQRERSVTLPIL